MSFFSEIICSGCKQAVTYPLSAPSFRCRGCSTLNAAQNLQIKCPQCKIKLLAPINTLTLLCSSCLTIVDIPEELLPPVEEIGPERDNPYLMKESMYVFFEESKPNKASTSIIDQKEAGKTDDNVCPNVLDTVVDATVSNTDASEVDRTRVLQHISQVCASNGAEEETYLRGELRKHVKGDHSVDTMPNSGEVSSVGQKNNDVTGQYLLTDVPTVVTLQCNDNGEADSARDKSVVDTKKMIMPRIVKTNGRQKISLIATRIL